MADVKWVKLATNIFDNRKIRQIECLPDGDAIIVTWLKLLCLAGNINDSGYVYFTKEIPYTDQMLSTQFNMSLSTIQLALRTFEQFGMIEVIDNILHISNWEKYQNIEGMEKIREQNRIRKQRQREKEKLLLDNGHEMSRDSHATEEDKEEDKDKDKEEEKELDKEIDKEKDKEKEEKITCKQVVDLFNSLCPSYPSIRSLSEARKKAIKARLITYNIDDFRDLFYKAEASDFLKGKNDRNWSANFDWLIKDASMAKVLDGNYDNRVGSHKSKNNKAQELDDFYNMAADWAEGGE